MLAEPREKGGLYWGYVTRLAHSLQDMMESCPFPGAVMSAFQPVTGLAMPLLLVCKTPALVDVQPLWGSLITAKGLSSARPLSSPAPHFSGAHACCAPNA